MNEETENDGKKKNTKTTIYSLTKPNKNQMLEIRENEDTENNGNKKIQKKVTH